MITTCYRTKDGALRESLSLDEIALAIKDPDGLLWVDSDGADRDESEALLRDIFHFHQLTIDDCFNTLIDPPKIDDYGAYLFVILHHVRYDASSLVLSTAEVDLYLGSNYVVTFHRTAVSAIDEVRRRALNQSPVFERGADFLAHAVFDVIVDDLHPVVEAIDEQVSDIEEVVIDHPERRVLEEVLKLKRNAQRLKRSILPQRDVANRFSRGDYRQLIGPDSLIYFRDIYDHTVRVEEMVDTVRDLSDSALNTYLSAVNNRINEVMKTLAIVTVVFLPLTLIAGVYGTNFDNVPEYGLRFGYPGMLISMGLVVVALVAWFRWRRWI